MKSVKYVPVTCSIWHVSSSSTILFCICRHVEFRS